MSDSPDRSTMNPTEIEHDFLVCLYEDHFRGVERNYDQVRIERGWPYQHFETVAQHLVESGVVVPGSNSFFSLEVSRIPDLESGTLTTDLVAPNVELREQIVDLLAQPDSQEGVSDWGVHHTTIEKLAPTSEIDRVRANLFYLLEHGIVEHAELAGFMRLTRFGRWKVADFHCRRAVGKSLNEALKLPPQTRGATFERAVELVIQLAGWNTERNVTTREEEIDIVISKERSVYLVECKWKSKPVGARVVREFCGKLDNRVGVPGLIFSMSGFSAPAVSEVVKKASKYAVLLFGEKDFRAVLRANVFDELLTLKHRALLTRREVLYE